MADLKLTIRDLTLRAVDVPMAIPLATRVVVLETAPLLLFDLETEEGITGRIPPVRRCPSCGPKMPLTCTGDGEWHSQCGPPGAAFSLPQ